MKKEELRRLYKLKRKELPVDIIQQYQESIYKQVFQLEFSSIKNIHIFLSMENMKEIDTFPIIHFFRKKQKKIIVSKCNFENNTLSHFLLEENTVLKTNKFGVPEPVNAKEINIKEIDLVFVPMLISDEKKYRVGYGKGFYDRFLSDCKPSIKTIGINFFKPIKKIEDIHKFDVALNQIIYPI